MPGGAVRGCVVGASTRRIAARRLRPQTLPAHVATPGLLATGTRLPPVNVTRANGGTGGRLWQHLPDRGPAPRCGSVS